VVFTRVSSLSAYIRRTEKEAGVIGGYGERGRRSMEVGRKAGMGASERAMCILDKS
jgi:hypothetical protein